MKGRTGILLGALLLYHALAWARGKRQPDARTAPTLPPVPPRVSFLVAAWNASHQIPDFVSSFRALSYPDKELVLCAGGSDESYAVARELAGSDVMVVEQRPGEGKQGALRRAYPCATGDVLYLTDIDCRPDDAPVNALLAPILAGCSRAVTGPSRPLDRQMGNPFVQVQWAVEQATEPHAFCRTGGILGRNAALTRATLEAAGGFEPDAPSGTDYALAKQIHAAGVEIHFVPDHPMPTEYAEDAGSYRRQQSRWIRNVFTLGRKYRAGREVWAASRTLSLPYLLLGGLAAGVKRRAILGPTLLLIAHAFVNRLQHERAAGLPAHPAAALRHLLATQAAALAAGRDIILQREEW